MLNNHRLRHKNDEFTELFVEFSEVYLASPEAQARLVAYSVAREEARANLKALVAADARGEDVTEAVLFQLLPYADTSPNRERGFWIHPVPALKTDARARFESAGWVQPQEWPAVARAILTWVRRCVAEPAALPKTCQWFFELPYAKGFQAGTLSPILNALRPITFVLLNNKSRRVINYFAGTEYTQDLCDYAEANTTGCALIEIVSPTLRATAGQLAIDTEVRPQDLFDLFCHWLVTIRQYDFGNIAYWKITPGEAPEDWDAWREGGFIAMATYDLGDLSNSNRAEFNALCAELLAEHSAWTPRDLEQVWMLAHEVKVGDRIIVSRGGREVLAVGTVCGAYEFIPDSLWGHHVPVSWDDLIPHPINEPTWRATTLLKLKSQKFARFSTAPFPVNTGGVDALIEPLAQIFTSREEADLAFDWLKKTLARLGVGNAEDERFAVTLRDAGHTLCLYFGNWAVLQFYGPSYTSQTMSVALLDAEAQSLDLLRPSDAFATEDGVAIRAYTVPIESALPMKPVLFQAYERSLAYIAGHFQNWRASNYRRFNQSQIAEAIFDIEKRERLFAYGLNYESECVKESTNLYTSEAMQPTWPPYTLERCADETGFDVAVLAHWVRNIERKGQAILYGPPGTGKTYMAELLARHLVGGGNGFWDLVQFHPAYAYEDFIQGIRPVSHPDGSLAYPLVPGRFLTFCEAARARQGVCVLIIDEINRTDLARVFGEVLYLLEYRDREITLAAGGTVQIPKNVRILGTMNTADRSIALVDYALRRRFAFLSLFPDYDVLRRYHQETDFPIAPLIQTLKRINARIGDPHYYVGITFFLHEDLGVCLEDIWRSEIEPYLEEFFFDQPEQVQAFRWDALHLLPE